MKFDVICILFSFVGGNKFDIIFYGLQCIQIKIVLKVPVMMMTNLPILTWSGSD